MIGFALAVGLPALALHVLATLLTWALRTYSRTLLEEICAARGHPARAERVAHDEERTERAAELLATLGALVLAAVLVAVAASRPASLAIEGFIGASLAVAAIAHLGAGVMGRVHAEPLLDALWPLTGAIRVLMAPLTGVLGAIEAFAYRRSSLRAAGPRPASVEVEFEAEGDESDSDGEIDLPESTREMMERVIELTRRDVHELMTPRSAILALPATVTADEAARAFADSGYSRIPLYGENRDDIVGILYAKDLYARVLAVGGDPARNVVPRKLVRPPLYIPESKNAAELLTEFQSRHVQLAIVLDEYGGVAGLISLEDLLEELVGEIVDEHDIPKPEEPIKQLGESLYEVDATLPIEDLNEQLGLKLPTDEDFSTVGGLAFSTFGHLPEPGTSFRRDGIEFTVLRIEGRSIRRLRVDLHPSEAVNSQPS